MQHNSNKNLKFSSLQSAFAKNFLAKLNITTTQLSTIYYFENGLLLEKSNAVLAIAKHLSAPYCWLNFFNFLPISFRNFFYTFIAKNRYRFFGKRNTCRIASVEEKARFIED